MVRTLIVEDDRNFRMAIKGILEGKFPSMIFDEASDGQEALRNIRTSLPDIIIMDIKLPGENGLQLTERIKGRYPKIVIIMLTSYDLPEYRDASFEKGANHFLCKLSSSTDEILKLVESVLTDLRSARRPVEIHGESAPVVP